MRDQAYGGTAQHASCDRSAPGVKWNDIAGLGDAKELLRENIALPLALPELFTGIRRPVKVQCTMLQVPLWSTTLSAARMQDCGLRGVPAQTT